MCGVGTEFDLLMYIEEDKQYKLEDFGEVVAWNKDGTPFMAYRDNKKKDIPQGSDYHGNGQHYSSKKKEQSFEDNDNSIDMIGL